MLLSCATGSEQFLGSEAIATYATAKAVILPIPYEATTTYRKGCETGPVAVITASQQLEAYDEELKRETCLEVGIYTHEAIADTRQQPQLSAEEMLAVTTATVSRLIADDKFVVAVGGEHAITTGVVQAYQQALSEPFTVVQIDAHGDMRFEYEGSHHNHACVMRRVLEMGLPTLPVKAIAKITTEKVFLTIDVDGIDPALIPGVGTPEPGGLSWHQTLGFLRRLFQTHQVIGCDVMELAPISDSVVSEFTTAKLIYKLIGYQFTA
ncbi:MAG: agmatinase family protein [Microcystis aeruginosa K13-07]|nr:agmatinase family protein [Microcystis aeruginosa K13-07]